SAVTSVTDTPPTLLVCANRKNDSYAAMKENGVLCVNTLTPAQEALSPLFAGMTNHKVDERFDSHIWHTLATGAPVLDQAVVVFDCRITQIVEVGTHDVFFCSVEAVRTGDAHEGLIYYGRGYHRVAAT
ncbi:MAG: flavin reductase, partial [Acetobacteraceae bacterium]|nr:flavin reductase [Acetobacteraceae bacterium]